MYCRNCGSQIYPRENFCTVCGTKAQAPSNIKVAVPVNNVVPSNPEAKKKADLYCVISLVLFFAGPMIIGMIGMFLPGVLANIVEYSSPLCIVAAIVFLVLAKTTDKQNKLVKEVMWVYLGLLFISLGLLMLLAFAIVFLLFSLL